MAERIPFIFNPKSRGGLSNRVKNSIMDAATNLTVLGTNSVKESNTIIDQYLQEQVKSIVVAGGDGTLNSVLPKFLGSSTNLGVFPSGTMNVFARELGISTTDPDHAIEVVLKNHIIETDVFLINGAPFVQMAGIGYDAHFIEETSEESKRKLGPLAYVQSIAKVFGNKPPQIQVTTADGAQESGVCVLLGNGSFYAGHFPLFKNARNDDGLIDALLIKSSGYQAILDIALNFLNKDLYSLLQNTDSVTFLQSKSLQIRSEEELPYELDGEYYGRDKEFTIEKSPHKLKVHAPAEKPKNDFNERLSALWSLTGN